MAENLRLHLKKIGLSITGLANEIDIQPSIVYRFIRGETVLNGETLQKIVDCLNVSVDYLLDRTDDPKVSSKQMIDGVLQEVRDADGEVDELIELLREDPEQPIMFDGEYMDAETRLLLADALRVAKQTVIAMNKRDAERIRRQEQEEEKNE